MRSRKPEQALTPEAARNKALRLLGRREHSARELSSKLRLGGVEAALTTEVVESLTEDGWQSDPRFASSRIQNRIAQGLGPIRISAELRVAGLPDALIREAMEAADCDWTQLCVDTYQRKYRLPAADRAERQKRYNHLAARGFTSDHIRAALQASEDSNDN